MKRHHPLRFLALRQVHPSQFTRRHERGLDILGAFLGIGCGLMFLGMAVAFWTMGIAAAAISFFCLGALGVLMGWSLGESVRRDDAWRDAGHDWSERQMRDADHRD